MLLKAPLNQESVLMAAPDCDVAVIVTSSASTSPRANPHVPAVGALDSSKVSVPSEWPLASPDSRYA